MTTNFNKDLSLLNPTKLVNDKNANAPLTELQENIEYILNFLNGNKALLSGVFGNLFDYNQDGKRISNNGGKFDTFKKCNLWMALNELKVSNDTEIIFDQTSERLVYAGQSNSTANREKWIEREFWIPETLRGQKLVFALKASSSTEQTGWNTSNALFETLAIQVLGAKEEINDFKVVGPWANHSYFSNQSYGDPMLTVYVPFITNSNTRSVKIKILRTSNSGYLHIDRAFIGGIATPYENDIEEYNWRDVDISEVYDFDNAVTKVISTGVLGHKVPDRVENRKGADLVIWDHLQAWMKEFITKVAENCNLIRVTGQIDLEQGQIDYVIENDYIRIDSVPSFSVIIPPGENGKAYEVVATGTSGKALEITGGGGFDFSEIEFDTLNDCTTAEEVIEALLRSETCEYGLAPKIVEISDTYGPSATPYTYHEFEVGIYKDIRVEGVINIEDGSMDVRMSISPDVSGYKLLWTVGTQIDCDVTQIGSIGTTGTNSTGTTGTTATPEIELGNYFHPEKAINILTETGPISSNEPDPTIYPNIFNYNI